MGALVIVGALSSAYYVEHYYEGNTSIVTKTESAQSSKVNRVT